MTPAEHAARRSRRQRCRSLLSAASVAGVVLLAVGCDEGPRPVAPTPVVVESPPQPPVRYTLSGVVFEEAGAGRRPIEGVSVYCDSCGDPLGHTFVFTDDAGFYSLAWAANGETRLLVEKEGFREAAVVAHVLGDTRFDIQLARR